MARESWAYRFLLLNLVRRDLKVRYRSSLLGFAWTFLNPLMLMAVFSIVFTVFLRIPAPGVPFPAFFLVGLLAWNFCVTSVVGSVGSIVGNAAIAGKVYFPKAILPLAVVLAGAVNFVLALVVLVPVLLAFHVHQSWLLTYFPLILSLQIIFLAGIALIVASANVFFRDTAPIVEVLLQAWFFLTPIIYDLYQAVPSWHGIDVPHVIQIANPMASIVILYQQIFLYSTIPAPLFLGRTLVTVLAVFAIGWIVFTRLSDSIADEL